MDTSELNSTISFDESIDNDNETSYATLIENDDSGDTINIDSNLNKNDTYVNYYVNSKKTLPLINIYEKTKLISVRAQQISNGSKAFIQVPTHITNSIDIAKLEYAANKIPFMIRRYTNNNEHEDWRLSELINK